MKAAIIPVPPGSERESILASLPIWKPVVRWEGNVAYLASQPEWFGTTWLWRGYAWRIGQNRDGLVRFPCG